MSTVSMRWKAFVFRVKFWGRRGDLAHGFAPLTARLQRGHRSIEVVAHAAGVPPHELRAFETWGARPRLDQLRQLATALDVEALDLIVTRPATPLLWLLRVKAGHDRDLVATSIGVPSSDLARLESGLLRAAPDQTARLAALYEVNRSVIDEAARRASTVAIVGVGGMVPGWRLPSRGLIVVANWLIVVGVAWLLFSRFAVGVMESGVEPSSLPSFEWVGVVGVGAGVAGVIVYCSIALPIVRWSLLVVSIIGLTAAALIYGRASGDVREWARAVGVLAMLVLVALLLSCMLRIATMSQFVVESVRRRGQSTAQRITGGVILLVGATMLWAAGMDCDEERCVGPSSVLAHALDRPPTDGPNLFDEVGFLLVAAGAAAILNLFGTRREDGLLTGTERLNLFLVSLPSYGGEPPMNIATPRGSS